MHAQLANELASERRVREGESHKVPKFSERRLSLLRDALQRHIGEGKNAGLVGLVHHRGKTAVESLGTMAFDSSKPMKRDAIFRLASTTKPITSVAAMILIEECRLRLDDPVDKWLPELAEPRVLRRFDGPLDDTVPAARRITVRDLLTFRSGHGEVGLVAPTCPLAMAMFEAGLPLSTFPFQHSPDEFMRRLGNLPLACQPGERWFYHMGLEILGVLIARETGMTLGEFMRQRIFEPLGMNDTGFHVPASKRDRLPTCYGINPGEKELIDLCPGNSDYATHPVAFESGAGGLMSTVDDLLIFGQMLMNNGVYGRQRILSRPTIELMATEQLTPEQKLTAPFFPGHWQDHGWGLGVGLVTARTDVGNSPGKFGWDGAFGTSLWVDPREQLVGVLMGQRRPDELALSTTARDFWTSAYQLIED